MKTLSVVDVSHTYVGHHDVTALHSVSLMIPEGELTAVLGPSGCGKSTLLRVMAGMVRPDAGTVTLGSRTFDGPGVHLPPERRAVGLVPQEGALFPHLDVHGNIAFGLRGMSRAQRRVRVCEMLELVGMTGLEHRSPHQLSGGQQQRVALARALAPQPDVVLLDEPFSALDTGLREALRTEVYETLRAAGTTAVLVTHDQTEAMTMADTLAVMRDGRIVQVGRPAAVYHRPVDEWVATFLGDAVLLTGTRPSFEGAGTGADTVICALGELPLAQGFAHHPSHDVTVFCRPEQLSADHGPGAVRAMVTSVDFRGPDALVSLEIDGVSITARWPSIELPQVGGHLGVVVTGRVLAFP